MKWTLILLNLILAAGLYAGMGTIIPDGSAVISEPSQKAIILHNGKEEVLVLGTDIAIFPAQPVVRFIPFPSAPEVSIAPAGAFTSLSALVVKKNLRMVVQTKGADTYRPADVLLFSKRLGAHEITAIRLKDIKHFNAWVRNFLADKKLAAAGLTEKASAVAADYLRRGYQYFVFDIVRPAPGTNTVDPVTYRFASKQLYYPLKTSALFGGNGNIRLFICAPTARNLYGMIERPYEVSTTAAVDPKELAGIYQKSGEFFGRKKASPLLQAVSIDGDMNFSGDILLDPTQGLPGLDARE